MSAGKQKHRSAMALARATAPPLMVPMGPIKIEEDPDFRAGIKIMACIIERSTGKLNPAEIAKDAVDCLEALRQTLDARKKA